MKIFLVVMIFVLLSLNSLADEEIITVDKVKIGMKGYGKTVFKGAKIEKFDVEVVDIVKNFLVKKDVVLVRCSHPVIEKANIIGGMSGSPIYLTVDGKDYLLGALAYGWSWSKEPLAGVMPAQYMIEELKRPKEKTSYIPKVPRDSFLQPCSLPLVVNGFSAKSVSRLKDELKDFYFEPMQGGGDSSSLDLKDVRLEPGSAFGVLLMSGDLTIAAVGTTTYVKDNKVLAFGHPVLNGGEMDFPITNGWIYTVVPSIARSNKFGTPGVVLGSLVQDRATCVYGEIGKESFMIPVSITISNPSTSISEKVSLKVIQHQFLTSRLLNIALFESIDTFEQRFGFNSAFSTLNVKFKDGRVLEAKDYFVGRFYAAGDDIITELFKILENRYEETKIENIEFAIAISSNYNRGDIESVWLQNNEISPGEENTLYIKLRKYRGEEKLFTTKIRIPENIKGQNLSISISGGAGVSPDLLPPKTISDLINYAKAQFLSTDLIVTVYLPSLNLRFKSETYKNLPSSVLALLAQNIKEDAQISSEMLIYKIPTEFIIYGSANLNLKVKEK